MINLGIVSLKLFFVIMAPLKKTEEGVCSSIYFVLTVFNPKMISIMLLDPPSLIETQVFCIHKPTNVVMVGQDKDVILESFQKLPLHLESFNNC